MQATKLDSRLTWRLLLNSSWFLEGQREPEPTSAQIHKFYLSTMRNTTQRKQMDTGRRDEALVAYRQAVTAVNLARIAGSAFLC